MSGNSKFLLLQQEAVNLLEYCALHKDSIIKANRQRNIIKREINTLQAFIEYVDAVLYSYDFDILLPDDSFFQFNKYSINGEEVYRYVFMQNPKRKISFDEFCVKNGIDKNDGYIDSIREIYDDDESPEVMTLIQFPLYLRFDVDKKGYNPNLHSYAHLHVGTFGDARIPARQILTPPAFVSMVIKMIYPNNWERMLNLQKGNQLYDFKRQCQKVEKTYWNIMEDRDIFLY